MYLCKIIDCTQLGDAPSKGALSVASRKMLSESCLETFSDVYGGDFKMRTISFYYISEISKQASNIIILEVSGCQASSSGGQKLG
jgi:hypothetical protein